MGVYQRSEVNTRWQESYFSSLLHTLLAVIKIINTIDATASRSILGVIFAEWALYSAMLSIIVDTMINFKLFTTPIFLQICGYLFLKNKIQAMTALWAIKKIAAQTNKSKTCAASQGRIKDLVGQIRPAETLNTVRGVVFSTQMSLYISCYYDVLCFKSVAQRAQEFSNTARGRKKIAHPWASVTYNASACAFARLAH